MVVVSDTSVLIALHSLARMELLKQFYLEVFIPPAVRAEFFNKSQDPLQRSAALELGGIECRAPHDSAHVARLNEILDQGEAEALALAQELKADLILMDEQQGRATARSFGFAVLGVVGILLRAKRENLIEALKPELDTLRREVNFHIGENLYLEALAAAGEQPPL